MARDKVPFAVGVSAGERQRPCGEVAVDTHAQQRLLQYLVALATDSPLGAVEQPCGFHGARQAAYGVGGIVVAMVKDGAIRLEAAAESVAVAETVVHPAGEGI